MSNRVLISGANSGLGLGFVQACLKSGDQVIALSRHTEPNAELLGFQKEYPEKLRHQTVDFDSRQIGVQLAELKMAVDKIDVLINCAGMYPASDELPFEQAVFDDWEKAFAVNVIGTAKLTQALLPSLLKSAHPKVVNITSLMGSIDDNSSGGSYAYRISKAALNMWTRSFTVDHPQIAVVLLHPGWVRTKMGGSQAPTSIEESVRGMLLVIQRATLKTSGKFFDFEGDELPW